MMRTDELVEWELQRHDWPNIRDANGPATNVPTAFRLLLAAKMPAEAEAAYWMFENHVVVQRYPSEAAAHCVPVICAALVDGGRPDDIREWLLELLFQIVSGNGGPEAVAEQARTDAVFRECRAEARKAIWLFYRELATGAHAAAYLLLSALETDGSRSTFIVDKLGLDKDDTGMALARHYAAWMAGGVREAE